MKTPEEAREDYANGYYWKMLEEGLRFQDFVSDVLYRRGIVLGGFASRHYQLSHGENILGAEIKLDKRLKETGNLYIEVAEKAHPDNPTFAASGIWRTGNSWLFIIGDETVLYVFSIKYLRMLEDRYEHIETPTGSKGFLMPVEDADKYCLLKVHP